LPQTCLTLSDIKLITIISNFRKTFVFDLASNMERPFEFIADITDKKDFWKLAVKVKDKWTVV